MGRGFAFCWILVAAFDKTPALFRISLSIRSDLGNRIRLPAVGDGKVP